MTKVEQKRIEDARARVGAIVRKQLAQKRNDILEGTGDWAIKKIENRLAGLKDGTLRPDEGRTREGMIELMEKRLTKKYTIAFNATKEAEISYDGKVDRMIDKMIAKGLRTRFLKVEQVDNYNREMEFLVHGENDQQERMTIHARVIYVHGCIVAPHYRFITTVRKAKNK
jgi:hypothetical protein